MLARMEAMLNQGCNQVSCGEAGNGGPCLGRRCPLPGGWAVSRLRRAPTGGPEQQHPLPAWAEGAPGPHALTHLLPHAPMQEVVQLNGLGADRGQHHSSSEGSSQRWVRALLPHCLHHSYAQLHECPPPALPGLAPRWCPCALQVQHAREHSHCVRGCIKKSITRSVGCALATSTPSSLGAAVSCAGR